MKSFTFFVVLLCLTATFCQQVFRVRITDRSNLATFSSSYSTPLIATTTGSVQWFTEGVGAAPVLEAFAEDALSPTDAANLGTGAFPAGPGNSFFVTEGPLRPGNSQQFQITATPDQRLHIALKYRQSNDLFFSFPPTGIALFDEQGIPISGDVSGQVILYDAGTEINEEPGIGINQPDRSGGPSPANCTCNQNGVITPVASNLDNEGFFYDSPASLITVEITPCTELQLDIIGMSAEITLGEILVTIAEPRGTQSGQIMAVADPGFRTSPQIFASSLSEGAISLATTPFESLFTLGDATSIIASLNGLFAGNTVSTLINNFAFVPTPTASETNVTVGPFYAAPGDRIFFFVQNTQTTDRYYAPAQDGINIFNGPAPIFGDYTNTVQIWDAGLQDSAGSPTMDIPPRLSINERPITPDTPIANNIAFAINPFVIPDTTASSSDAAHFFINLSLFFLALVVIA